MDRREMLKYLAGGMAATLLPAAWGACARQKGKVPLPAWTWYLAGKDRKKVEKDLALLSRYGFEGVHFQGDDETVAWAAGVARRHGLRLHRWLITLLSRDEKVRKEHPDWFVVSRDGRSSLEHPPYVAYYTWLCPNREGVVNLLEERVRTSARIPGVVGVHLDYIRYPDVILPRGLWKKYGIVQDKEYPQYDFCYCEVCRGLFREAHGVDPLELPDPSSNPAWLQFRYDSITKLVTRLKEVAKAEGRQLTAAVFPTPSIARRLVRQQWERWPLDAVFPMIYHKFYEKEIPWIKEAVREGEEALQGKFPLYAGLFIPAIEPGELSEAVRYAREGGARGVSLFRFAVMNEEHWKNFLT